jgi:prophage maintenance system killer protein
MCEVIYETLRQSIEEGKIILGDPLPPLEERIPGALESITGSIKFRSLYHKYDLVDLAAIYFTWFAKSQAFPNGNKRMAVIITDNFLWRYSHHFDSKFAVLHDVAIKIALDVETSRDEIVTLLTTLFRRIIVPNETE